MIVVADSGSTKCDWKLTDNDGNLIGDFHTQGFNPFFHNEVIVSNAIKQNKELFNYASEITHVFYYGAGCSTENYRAIIRRALGHIFENADLNVEHDLAAAVYATYDGQPCISCILGTGSNAAYYDGINIHEFHTGLGFILGDEGSGSYFGKMLLSNYLYKKLPEEIHDAFYKKFGLTKDTIFQNVYNRPHANVYLAGFVRFLANYKEHPYVRDLLKKGMTKFFEINVLHQEMAKEVPIHFVGSVAFYYKESIYAAAEELGITVGNIVQRPIDLLVKHHIEKAQVKDLN